MADILRHEGGLTKFDTSLSLADLAKDKIKENVVGRIIEKQKLVYGCGNIFLFVGEVV